MEKLWIREHVSINIVQLFSSLWEESVPKRQEEYRLSPQD